MAVELEKAVNNFLNSEHVKKIFGNPIIVGVIIAVIIVVIMMVVLRNQVELVDDDRKSFFKLAATTGIYVLATSIGAIYLHTRVLSGSYEQQYENHAMQDTVASVIGRAETPAIDLDVVNRTVMGDGKIQRGYREHHSSKQTKMRPRRKTNGKKVRTHLKKSKPLKTTKTTKKHNGGSDSVDSTETESADEILEEATTPEVSDDSSYEE